MSKIRPWLILAVAASVALLPGEARPQATDARPPIVYTVRFPAPETHIARLEARVPTAGAADIELMMPGWSPGYYGLGDYARNVRDFAARTADGAPLAVRQPAGNHWLVETGGSPDVIVSYGLFCETRFVTGCWVGPDYAVLNGPAVFITRVETGKRRYEVRLERAPSWPAAVTGLEPAPDGGDAFVAPDYDTFADAPIVLGDILVHEAEVPGTRVVLADFGEPGRWDGAAVVKTLARIVDEHRRMMGGRLPFDRYVFLNAMRGGGGGLEHLNSSLLSSPRNPDAPTPGVRWLMFASHEFFHAINVKRLRPVELGPFDYDRVPRTPGLWISEGLTSWYGDLAVVRAGLATRNDFLASISGEIGNLQTTPGRLVQTLTQASIEVGSSAGSSGVGVDRATTVSYYEKGVVVGLLLDAKIRRATNGAKSLDDVMRLAYARYSGVRGFTPDEFRRTASEVAGTDLAPFFHTALDTTDELDYSEMLDWFGLRFAEPGSTDPARAWALEVRPDATDAQTRHLTSLFAPSA